MKTIGHSRPGLHPLFMVCILVSLVTTVRGQQAADVPQTPNVTIPFAVVDKSGVPVDVTSSDVLVIDNKKPARTIVNIRSGAQVPLRFGLLIDTSGSQQHSKLFKAELQNTRSVLAEELAAKNSSVFVIAFSDFVRGTDFLDQEHFLKLSFDFRLSGGTALHDALYQATEVFANQRETELTRRALILLTDGEDDASRLSFQQLLPALQRAGIPVFSISLGGNETPARGRKTLEGLAETTGGQAFLPTKADGIPVALQAIRAQLNGMYFVTYVPAEYEAGKYHSVEIKVATKGTELLVRAPKGYYAPK
jgi:Ca-activated chloride channel homolog